MRFVWSQVIFVLLAGGAVAALEPGPTTFEEPVQVNIGADGANVFGDAANEPTLAIHPDAPNRLVAVWRQFDSVTSELRTAGWTTSLDGGRSWSSHGSIEPGVFSTDPVLAADAAGRIYALGLDAGFTSCRLHRSDNGGDTWDVPVPAHGGDKPWMAVDPARRHIYIAWDSSYSCCGDRTFTRSTDSGESFNEPIIIDPAPSLGTIAVGPEGEVYVAGILDIATFAVARSEDARNPAVVPTFEVTTVDLGGFFGFVKPPNPGGLVGMPWVASNNGDGPDRGAVYLLASVDPPGSDPLDVHIVRSDNGGRSWSEPVTVNQDRTAGWQWFGTLSISPGGRLDVVWYDSPDTDHPEGTSVVYSSSSDGGQSWDTPITVSPEFDSHLGWPERQRIGDYIHLVSDRLGADLVFAATFNGEQDIYYLRIGPRDCNRNGVPDADDLLAGVRDCDHDGVPDSCEIASGAESDVNGDGVPDRCQPAPRRPTDRVIPGSPIPVAPRPIGETTQR